MSILYRSRSRYILYTDIEKILREVFVQKYRVTVGSYIFPEASPSKILLCTKPARRECRIVLKAQDDVLKCLVDHSSKVLDATRAIHCEQDKNHWYYSNDLPSTDALRTGLPGLYDHGPSL